MQKSSLPLAAAIVPAAPALATLAPLAAFGFGVFLLCQWLRKREPTQQAAGAGHAAQDSPEPSHAATPQPAIVAESVAPSAISTPAVAPLFTRKVTLDKLAAVFAAGPLRRAQAVAALRAGGAGKSAAYDALRADGPFAACLQEVPGGVLTFKSAVPSKD